MGERCRVADKFVEVIQGEGLLHHFEDIPIKERSDNFHGSSLTLATNQKR
jgi:hypothetical protein